MVGKEGLQEWLFPAPVVPVVDVDEHGSTGKELPMDMDWIRPIIVVTIPTIGLVVWLARWFRKHSEWVKGMEEFKQDTKETLAEIREDIKKLLAAQPRSVIAGASPMQLTDLGKEVSECVGAAAWAEQLAPRLIDDVKANNAYEVQEFCVGFMRNEYEPTAEQDQRSSNAPTTTGSS